MPYTDPAVALQAAIYAVLMADAGVDAAFPSGSAAVYDRVPLDPAGRIDTAAFPYITIGEDQIIGHTNQYYDPSEAQVKVEVWSRYPGYREAKLIAAAVRNALDAYIPIIGFGVISHTFVSSMPRAEPDGLTRRVVLNFKYTIGPGFRTSQASPL